MTSVLALLAHWSVRQKLNCVSSVQLRRCVRAFRQRQRVWIWRRTGECMRTSLRFVRTSCALTTLNLTLWNEVPRATSSTAGRTDSNNSRSLNGYGLLITCKAWSGENKCQFYSFPFLPSFSFLFFFFFVCVCLYTCLEEDGRGK